MCASRSRQRGVDDPWAIWYAARFSHLARLRATLARGVSVDAREPVTGRTPLHYAVKYEQWQVLPLLLELHADINAADSDAFTPLHFAAAWASIRLVFFLLERGANPVLQNVQGRTPGQLARHFGRVDTAEALERWVPVGGETSAPRPATPYHPPPALPPPPSAEAATARRAAEHRRAVRQVLTGAHGEDDDEVSLLRHAASERQAAARTHGTRSALLRTVPPLRSLAQRLLQQGRHAEAVAAMRDLERQCLAVLAAPAEATTAATSPAGAGRAQDGGSVATGVSMWDAWTARGWAKACTAWLRFVEGDLVGAARMFVKAAVHCSAGRSDGGCGINGEVGASDDANSDGANSDGANSDGGGGGNSRGDSGAHDADDEDQHTPPLGPVHLTVAAPDELSKRASALAAGACWLNAAACLARLGEWERAARTYSRASDALGEHAGSGGDPVPPSTAPPPASLSLLHPLHMRGIALLRIGDASQALGALQETLAVHEALTRSLLAAVRTGRARPVVLTLEARPSAPELVDVPSVGSAPGLHTAGASRALSALLTDEEVLQRVEADRVQLLDLKAQAHWALGHWGEAKRLYEDVAGMLRASYPPDHPRVRHAERNVAASELALHAEARMTV